MIKCCDQCAPCCQHCIYAKFEHIIIGREVFNGEAVECKIHPEKNINGSYYCDNFHCFQSITIDKARALIIELMNNGTIRTPDAVEKIRKDLKISPEDVKEQFKKAKQKL